MQVVTFGETVTNGMAVYLKSDTLYWKAKNNGTLAEYHAVGIVLSGGTANQQGVILTSGECIIGATLVVGQTYILSANFGGVCPIADLASTRFLTYIGYASTAAILRVGFNATGIALA